MRATAFTLLICVVFPFAAKSAGISGSSVLISWDGYLITAEHVIAECPSLNVINIGPVVAVGHDKANDLALLKSNVKIIAEPLPLSMAPVRPGDEVIAVGYPYQGIVGDLNVTNGIVYGLPGNSIEFTAPAVQLGNSGGALLNRSGTLVGILSSKRTFGSGAFGRLVGILSSIYTFGGGAFAVRREVIQTFLSAQSVRPVLADGKPERSAQGIAALARKSVFAIECLN
jgi:S1-C subfamily serine protease